MRRDPRLPKCLRAGSSLLALTLLAATPAAPRVAAARPQDAEASTRAGVLKALIVLKIAPYLTAEPPPRPESVKEKVLKQGKDGKGHEDKDCRQNGERKDGEPKRAADGGGLPPRREYRIAIVGTDDVSRAAAQAFAGKCVGEAKVKVVELKPEHAADPELAAEYELLYVTSSVDTHTCKRIVAANEGRAIPVVGAHPGFAAMGGGVQLFVQDNVVKFEINADSLRRQGMRVDSQLLKLSKKGPP